MSALSVVEGLRLAERYRASGLSRRRFSHQHLWQVLEEPLRSLPSSVQAIGTSVSGRELRTVTFGRGNTSVLLWSQMHGDESTATMALADLIRFFAEGSDEELWHRMHENLHLTLLPMLNPDGAERFERHNALSADINRDARRLATPEGQALRRLYDRLQPVFAFNLHDQEARKLAGEEGRQVAMALLAPPVDEEGSYDATRSLARRVAARIAEALSRELAGRLARYEDTYDPRAFGDWMQRSGTSTVLIESGALPDDPEKQRLRALNVAALLLALDSIADGSCQTRLPHHYDALPVNESVEYDLILRGGRLVMAGETSFLVDIGLYYEDPVSGEGLRLRDAGDLSDARALKVLDVSGLYAHVQALSTGEGGLRPDARVRVTVRRGVSAASVAVHRF